MELLYILFVLYHVIARCSGKEYQSPAHKTEKEQDRKGREHHPSTQYMYHIYVFRSGEESLNQPISDYKQHSQDTLSKLVYCQTVCLQV